MTKILDLEKVHCTMNMLSERQSDLSELEDKYVNLLGHSSEYYSMEFDSFLEYYSFKIDGDRIVVFNDDGVQWEDYTNNDFSYIPLSLLSFSAEKIEKYMEEEIAKQLEQQEKDKIAQKEELKRQIEILTKRLEE